MAKKPTTEGLTEGEVITAPNGGLDATSTNTAADGTADGMGSTEPALVQAKPADKVAAEGEVTVEVTDTLNHDGQERGPGSLMSMPIADAIKLRALGVVSFQDPNA